VGAFDPVGEGIPLPGADGVAVAAGGSGSEALSPPQAVRSNTAKRATAATALGIT
jgi:hypothetical protein